MIGHEGIDIEAVDRCAEALHRGASRFDARTVSIREHLQANL